MIKLPAHNVRAIFSIGCILSPQDVKEREKRGEVQIYAQKFFGYICDKIDGFIKQLVEINVRKYSYYPVETSHTGQYGLLTARAMKTM